MSIRPISSDEISVVVQGPALDKDAVNRVVRSVRLALPGAEIILSTWAGQQDGVLGWDVSMESLDPGCFTDLNGRPCNHRRQARSSYRGLLAATRRYSLKIRVDTPMLNSNLCIYDDDWLTKGKPFKGKIVMPNTCVRDPLKFPQNYSLCDIAHFGLTEDLLALWSAADEIAESSFVMDENYRPRHWGNFIGYSRLRSVAEQTCLIALLNKGRAYETPVVLADPCDMSRENFQRARAALKQSFHILYKDWGVELPRRTLSPWFVRSSFVSSSGSIYLSQISDSVLWPIALANKYVFSLFGPAFWAPAVSHILFRHCPSWGRTARRWFHRFRGDVSFGSEGRRA
jgi:hypothetical protein